MELVKRARSSNALKSASSGRYTVTDEFPIRPSWCEAALSLQQIKNGNATGNKPALFLRKYLQTFLYYLGWIIQKYFFVVLTLGTLIFILFGIGLVKIVIETNIEKLWVPRGGRLESERDYAKDIAAKRAVEHHWTVITDKTGVSDDSATNFQVLIQNIARNGENVLTRDQLLMHANLMETLATFSVDKFSRNWTLADLCFKPKMPKLKGSLADIVGDALNNVIPCVILTPLDCFWEGSKPLGPFPPNDEIMGFAVAWKKLNPQHILNTLTGALSSFFDPNEIEETKDLFSRAGIGNGYQERFCIDPLDSECPTTSKNYVNFCSVLKSFLKWNTKNGGVYKLPPTNWTEPSSNDEYKDYYEGKSAPKSSRKNSTHAASTTKRPSKNGGTGDFLDLLAGADDADHTDNEPQEVDVCQNKPLVDAVKFLFRYDVKLAQQFIPNIWSEEAYGRQMTGGCLGYATKFMKWPEQLIVGGITRSQNGTIQKAEGLQSILMISNHNELYLRYADAKYNLTGWSPQGAVSVIKTWQRKYADIIFKWPNNSLSPRRVLHPLAAASLEDMVDEFSQFNPWYIIIGYVLMIIYACLSAISFAKKGTRSCCTLAFGGCMVVLLANISGLGCTLILGIDFNATTTQILPFLLLSLGVDEMFLLLNKYREIIVKVNHDEIAILLRETGLSVLITYVNNILAFLAGGMLPLPALKIFCIQVAVVLVFNLVAILTLFPALMALDLIRQRKGYIDVLCCFRGEKVGLKEPLKTAAPVTYYNGDTIQAHNKNGVVPSDGDGVVDHSQKRVAKCTLTNFVRNIYAPVIQKLPMKIVIVLVFVGFMIGAIVGVFRIPIGLELSEIIPAGTPPHAFFIAREKYFSFYPIYCVVRGPNFDYSKKQNQKLIRDFLSDMKNISYVVDMKIKADWLDLMSVWLNNSQTAYDKGQLLGVFNGSDFIKPSRAMTLAQKMICYNGKNSSDCARRMDTVRLIDEDGYINEDGFYYYLSAWYSSDQMTVYVSQANMYPNPPAWNYETDYSIPKAEIPTFTQFAVFIDKVPDTDAILEMIKQVRTLCEKYNGLGLPVFPLGIPFTFWELYLHLTTSLLTAFAIIIVAVFIAISIMLVNPWTAVLIVAVLMLMIVVELGFMGLIHIKLNPISAVTLITAVGIRVKFTVHVALSFLTTVGNRNERVARTLEHMFIPVLHGGVSTLVGLIMLAFSIFEFIVMYYFLIMFALVVLGILSGLILMPVILSWIGPPSEVRPLDGSSYLLPPDNFPSDNRVHPTDLPLSGNSLKKTAVIV